MIKKILIIIKSKITKAMKYKDKSIITKTIKSINKLSTGYL